MKCHLSSLIIFLINFAPVRGFRLCQKHGEGRRRRDRKLSPPFPLRRGKVLWELRIWRCSNGTCCRSHSAVPHAKALFRVDLNSFFLSPLGLVDEKGDGGEEAPHF